MFLEKMSNKPYKIFVVEDDDWYNRLLVHSLSLNPEYEVHGISNGKDCISRLSENPDLITLDYQMPDMKGLEVLQRIKKENERIQVILISEQQDIETVVELLKQGAYDYIVKSNDIKERLLNIVSNLRRNVILETELSSLKKEVQKKYSFQNSIIGHSNAIKKVFELIEKAVRTNITVSVTGETGTGKELVAKAIHYNSPRKDKPFVAVNVAAIPLGLIESELFGHEKGSFTGAMSRRIGKFEEADSGSLFLDEIAEMDPSTQVKVLRALQEKEITRVGSNTTIKINCRIIASTNKNLMEEVRKGNFRQDLFYRLIGLPIEIPPLRDRGNDVLILAKYFLNEFCKDNDLGLKTISHDAGAMLLNYEFPGNVRELKSVIELGATLSNGSEIQPSDILIGSGDILPEILNRELTLKEYERRIVDSFLKKYDNNIRLVSEKLDVGISTIYRMLKKDT